MRLSKIGLFPIVFLLTFSCANLHAADDNKSKNNSALDLLGTVAEKALKNAIDRKATLASLDVVEQHGNSVVVDVSYKRIYKYENIELQGVVLDGGKNLPGFSSTVASLDSDSGTARLTLKWDNAVHGSVVKSDQIKVYIKRDGEKLKSKVFDYNKEWTDLSEIVNDSSQGIQMADNDSSQGQVEEMTMDDAPNGSSQSSSPPATATESASTCVNSIQGKIAWNYHNSKTWGKTNLDRLCSGAETSEQPGVCFNQIMHSGVNWGGGTKWKWQNALNLCQGTKNANATVSCFKNEISNKHPWPNAIKTCKSSSANVAVNNTAVYAQAYKVSASNTCFNTVQGKIAWNYKGSKYWSKSNVAQLCKGAEASDQPGVCFNTIMHGGVNWGGGTKWKWGNALKLCQGTKNSRSTVNCFKKEIKAGLNWGEAIARCERKY